ncbi:MAG: pseudouridine synthase [Rubrivivax sp.]
MMIDQDPPSTAPDLQATHPTPSEEGSGTAAVPPQAAGSPAGADDADTTGATVAQAVDDDPASPAPRRKRSRRRSRRNTDRRGAAEADAASTQEVDAEVEPDVEVSAASPAVEPIDADALFAEVVSGAYDEAVEAAPVDVSSAKRILAPEPDAPKLQKVLAQAGVGSRRDLEQMIADGRLSVNGQPAHIGQRVSWGDRVALDGKPVKIQIHAPPPRVLAYHKPVGEIVTLDDPQQRPTVFRRLPRLPRGKWQSVGRLDLNTEGLLLFTNSGDLANRLMHPRFAVEREYAVRILGALSDEGRQRLLEGIEIEGQTATLLSIEDGGGEGANRWYRVVIAEGRNREVRRLFEAVGHAVSRLIRIRYGSVVLPRGLRRGAWVDLSPQDVKTLREVTGAARVASGPSDDGDARGPRSSRRGRKPRRGDGPSTGRSGADTATSPRDEDFEEPIGPIPNPLLQTYDRRAVQRPRGQRRVEDEGGPIPNPLVQTYDRRAAEAERRVRPDLDDEAGPIPNPLQQTYDRRFVQKGRAGGGGGPGAGAPGGHAGRKRPGGPRKDGKAVKSGPGGPGGAQPDPMRTSVGYIGADAFLKPAKGARPGRPAKGGRRR